MMRAHKIRIYPNNAQATHLKKACGTTRFAYNWALGKWCEEHESWEEFRRLAEIQKKDFNPLGVLPRKEAKQRKKDAVKKAEQALRNRIREEKDRVNEQSYRKQLNALKRIDFPWMYDVTKCAVQLAIKVDFASAFSHFLGKERFGFPRFKRKGQHDSFKIDYTALRNLTDINCGVKRLKIPNLDTPLVLAESLRFRGKILSVTISRTADKWYASFQVDVSDEAVKAFYKFPNDKNQVVGVDLGIKDLATLSNDSPKWKGSKATRQYAAQLRRQQKALSRKNGSKKDEAKSANYIKQQRKVARLHQRIRNTRLDNLHKLTTMLASNFSIIGIEDLNVSGMLKNQNLAKHIADGSFFELRRQLGYKTEITGSLVVVADMWFASSRLCHVCGYKNEELTLDDREWTCSKCNTLHDRDINAAKNLETYAINKAQAV